MKAAIKRYADIVARGGWQAVPDVELQPGIDRPGGRRPDAAAAVVRRPQGDSRRFASNFDCYLEKAVKRFQASNGLTPTGIVDKRTIAALNVPAAARLKQLQDQSGAPAGIRPLVPKKYVVVNIPAAQIEAVEGDRVVSRHAGVVGKIDRPTPMLQLGHPRAELQSRLAPAADGDREGSDPQGPRHAERRARTCSQVRHRRLRRRRQEARSRPRSTGRASPPRGLTFKQQPGKENPLGFVKINFHNNYSVYMHDTPSETLFGRNFRAAQLGLRPRRGHRASGGLAARRQRRLDRRARRTT